MRSTALVCLALVSACASSGAGSEQPVTPHTTRVVTNPGTGLTVTTTTSSATITGDVPFPLERVWAILPSVYDSLGIAPAEVNAASRAITASNLKVRRRLGTELLTRILDCGSGQGGPSAETYEIVMTVRTQLKAAGAAATTLASEIGATGKPVAFVGDYVRCTSKTTLEQKIVDAVKRKLGSGPN
jgi:hypothetical protein